MSIHSNGGEKIGRRFQSSSEDAGFQKKYLTNACERCVRIKNYSGPKEMMVGRGFSTGTGIIIETGLILTNYHAITDEGKITVNDHPAELVHIDWANDLAALKAKTRALRRIELSLRVPFRTQKIFYVANPDDHNKTIAFGAIVHCERNNIRTSLYSDLGISGGGLYDCHDGRLIGFFDTIKEFAIADAIPHRLIREFLSEALPRFERLKR